MCELAVVVDKLAECLSSMQKILFLIPKTPIKDLIVKCLQY